MAIVPVGPMPQYEIAARMINDERLSLRARAHVQHGRVRQPGRRDRAALVAGLVPARDVGAASSRSSTPSCARPRTRSTSRRATRSPTTARGIEALGGADVCYGGIGWSGHIAFWEPQLGAEFDGDLDAYRHAGARLVELHPMTVMQNALHSFGGDWSVGAAEGQHDRPARDPRRPPSLFWLDGDLGGGVSWQRFIARLVAHGPVSEFVPGSLLQEARTDYTILGSVADDVEIHMS